MNEIQFLLTGPASRSVSRQKPTHPGNGQQDTQINTHTHKKNHFPSLHITLQLMTHWTNILEECYYQPPENPEQSKSSVALVFTLLPPQMFPSPQIPIQLGSQP